MMKTFVPPHVSIVIPCSIDLILGESMLVSDCLILGDSMLISDCFLYHMLRTLKDHVNLSNTYQGFDLAPCL